MIYIPRLLDLRPIVQEKSCFLFGPRQTGKSALLEKLFPDHTVIDLLDEDLYLRLLQNPKNLSSYFTRFSQLVMIDEIQRVPALLNEIHRLIEKQNMRFVLTGSSARSLRKKGTNLLGGRARSRTLHPFVSAELKDHFDLDKVLHFGSIPGIYFSGDPRDDLKAYISEYLKEEIVAEAATRNIPAFSRFLEVAAVSNGQTINYEKVSRDAQVPRSTVQSYYQILRDTLIGYDLTAYKEVAGRKHASTAKFYFFDLGVTNYLRRIKSISENSADYGIALEAMIHHELKTFCDYKGDNELHFWRSRSGVEVDFIINNEWAIEVKSTKRIDRADLKGLNALAEEMKVKRKTIVCREPFPRKIKDIEILPIKDFLEFLWRY